MSRIVTRKGFVAETHPDAQPVTAGDLPGATGAAPLALSLGPDTDLAAVLPHLGRVALVILRMGGFADGRAFSQSARLRDAGFAGTVRIAGHVIPDQFRQALACGADEVEISDAQAARTPEAQWLAVGHAPGYRARVFAA